MTVEEVEREVTRIRGMAGDDEAAHSAEDDLWENVLRAVASGETDDSAGIAAAALKTKTIDFARWCA
jgi:hypothetical protein